MEVDSNLEEEILRFAETIYKCKLCTVVPSLHHNKAQFLKHFKGLHVSGQPVVHKCVRCLLKFGSEEDLDVHKQGCHSGETEHHEDVEEEEEEQSSLSPASSDECVAKKTKEEDPTEDGSQGPEMKDDAMNQVPNEKAPPCLPSPDQPSNNKLCIRRPEAFESTQENIKMRFGPFASTIISKNMLYFFCKVCLFKCSRDWEFAVHIQSAAHAERVLSRGKMMDNLLPKVPFSPKLQPYPYHPMHASMEDRNRLYQLYTGHALTRPPAVMPQAPYSNGKLSHKKVSRNLGAESVFEHHLSSTVLPADRKRLWTDHKAKQLTPGAKTRKLVDGLSSGAASSSLNDLEKLVGTIPMKPARGQGQDTEGSNHHEGASPKRAHKCAMCDYVYHNFDEYLKHCFEMHESMPESRQQFTESFKLATVVKYLPELLVESTSGVISRQEFLERLGQLIGEPDAIYWSSSSNKAFREIFPRGLVQRKGKFKETYYFGVRFKNSVEEVSVEDEDSVHEDEVPPQQQQHPNFSPMRDMTKDVDRLASILPNIVYWRGNMDRSVARDTILYTVKQITGDSETLDWGVQCNRAVRQLFPDVSIQRKGRFKTTCYFGVELIGAEIMEGDNPRLDHGWKSWRHIPMAQDMRQEDEDDEEEAEDGEDEMEEAEEEGPTDHEQEGHKVQTVAEVHAPPEEIIVKQEVVMPDEEVVETSHSPCPEPELTIDYQEEEDVDESDTSICESTILDPHNESLTFRHRHENNLQKIMLLHPGPFVTTRIICRHFRRLTPTVHKALDDMQILEDMGLGQLVTLKLGNCKAFFKALPYRELEAGLNKFGIKLVDYRLMFQERDPKLEEKLHERLRNAYPWPEELSKFYPY